MSETVYSDNAWVNNGPSATRCNKCATLVRVMQVHDCPETFGGQSVPAGTERLRQLMAKMADVLRNHQMDLGYDWNYYEEMNEDVVEVLAEYDAWLLS